MIDRAADDLLWRHVAGRPDDHPRTCHCAHDASDGLAARRDERSRHAEVREKDVAVGDQHVVRLDIAMDDALGMGVCQRVRQLVQDSDDFPDRQATNLPESGSKRLAVDERHDVERHRVRQSRVEERQDVRVLEVPRRSDL